MSKIKNGGLDQYGAGPFEQQQFGTAGTEVVNASFSGALLSVVHRCGSLPPLLRARHINTQTFRRELKTFLFSY